MTTRDTLEGCRWTWPGHFSFSSQLWACPGLEVAYRIIYVSYTRRKNNRPVHDGVLHIWHTSLLEIIHISASTGHPSASTSSMCSLSAPDLTVSKCPTPKRNTDSNNGTDLLTNKKNTYKRNLNIPKGLVYTRTSWFLSNLLFSTSFVSTGWPFTLILGYFLFYRTYTGNCVIAYNMISNTHLAIKIMLTYFLEGKG